MATRGQPAASLTAIFATLLLAGCGGGGDDAVPAPIRDDDAADAPSGGGNGGGGTLPPDERPDPTPPSGDGGDEPPSGGDAPPDDDAPPPDDDTAPPDDDAPPPDDDAGDPPAGDTAELYKPEAGNAAGATPVILTLHDSARDRDLDMRIAWPQDGSQLPLVVFSHGFNGSMLTFDPLVTHWVSYGYALILPDHSDSYLIPEEDRAGYEDWRGRVEDIVFVLDSLDAIEAAVPDLAGRIDRDRIGVAGHSYGANTAQLAAGATTILGELMLDPRIRAALLISPQGVGEMLDENSWSGFTNPMMVITGTNDNSSRVDEPWTWRLQPYELSPPGSKHLVVIDGAYHNFGGINGAPDSHDPDSPDAGPPNETHVMYVRSAGIAFLDAYLLQDAAAQAHLASDEMEVATAGAIDYEYK